MQRDIIEINKKLIPYEFNIVLADETFLIGVNYNKTADLFTLDLSKLNIETGEYDEVCKGEPIVYGKPLWEDVFISGKYPAVDIVPIDESGENNAVTFENLNETVFLAIDNSENDININSADAELAIDLGGESELVYCEEYIEELEEMIDDSGVLNE